MEFSRIADGKPPPEPPHRRPVARAAIGKSTSARLKEGAQSRATDVVDK